MKKITEQDLQGKGVIGLPDTPGLSREQMQEKFEETARQVIVPAFNALVDELGGAQGASAIGINPIDGFNANNVQEAVQVAKNKTDELTRSLAEQGTSLTQKIDEQGNTLNAKIDAQSNTLNAKIDAQDASLSAEIAAQETELKQYVDATVQKIGAADMQAIVYDPTHKAQDIFAYADAIGIEAKEYAAGIVAETAPSRLFVLTCTTTGTTHALTGLNGAQGLLTCAFTADADFAEGNTFTVDGNAYAVKMQDGSDAKAGLFVVGAKVQVLIDTEGQSVNFASSGGGAETFTATIPTSGWSASAPYTVSVAVSGILATDTPVVDVVLSNTAETAKAQLEAWGTVGRIVTSNNSITVYCYDSVPTTEIPIQLKVVR